MHSHLRRPAGSAGTATSSCNGTTMRKTSSAVAATLLVKMPRSLQVRHRHPSYSRLSRGGRRKLVETRGRGNSRVCGACLKTTW